MIYLEFKEHVRNDGFLVVAVAPLLLRTIFTCMSDVVISAPIADVY